MQTRIMKCAVLSLLVVFFSTVSFLPAARAGVISTETHLAVGKLTAKDQLQAALERQDVRTQLISLGVDPEKAKARVANLTQDEVAKLQSRIGDLPAGAGVIEVIGILFIVLLILELVGVINIFHKL